MAILVAGASQSRGALRGDAGKRKLETQEFCGAPAKKYKYISSSANQYFAGKRPVFMYNAGYPCEQLTAIHLKMKILQIIKSFKIRFRYL